MISSAYILIVAGLMTSAPTAEVEQTPSPRTWLESKVKEAHELMQARVSDVDSKERKEWEAKVENLLQEMISWPEMTKRALSRAQWKDLSDPQKDKFGAVYRRLLELNARSKLDAARKLEKKGEKPPSEVKIDWLEEKVRGDRAKLIALVKAGKEEQEVGFKLVRAETGWRVYDLILDGASTLNLTKSQFRRSIKENGWDGFLRALEQKIAQFESGAATLD